MPDPVPERRRWIEHLDAVGRFHWRRDRAATLVRSTREALRRKISTAHPAWARLPASALHERLAERTGLPPAQIDAALQSRPRTESDVVTTIADIERIRASL